MPVCRVPLVPDHLFVGSGQGAVAAAGAAGVAGLLLEPGLPAAQPHAPAESSCKAGQRHTAGKYSPRAGSWLFSPEGLLLRHTTYYLF